MNRVTLAPVSRSNWPAAWQLAVHPDQQRFLSERTPVVALLLTKTYVGAMGFEWMPHLFEVQGEIVGAAAWAAQEEVYWLMHFFIDARYQRNGYGREALARLIEQAQQSPHCHTLHLTVHPENVVAQQLYASMGFHPTGEWLDEEPVYQRQL